MKKWTYAIFLVCFLASQVFAADYIWWEAEDFKESNFPGKSGFDPRNDQEALVLSGGRWLSASHNRIGPTLFASYTIEVPKKGEYNLWARKFYKHGPFRWRFDNQTWRECGRNITLIDTVEIRPNLSASWVALGNVELNAGSHTFYFENIDAVEKPADAPEKNARKQTAGASVIAMDCFVLTERMFAPRGKLKPGEKSGHAEEGWFAFEPDTDDFGEAVLDLRFLNEENAGEQGYIVALDGRFVHEKSGKAVKFWGPAWGPTGPHLLDDASIDYLARRLAKAGVNMARIHANKVLDLKAEDPGTVDAHILDRIHYTVAAMKKQGIYTSLCLYYPINHKVDATWGLAGYEGKQPTAALFFHPRMQEIYRAWCKQVLTTVNPYTGQALNNEPALAFFLINNEDNYFWYSFTPYGRIPAPSIHILEKQFGDWLKKQYGSLEAARKAWGPDKYPHTVTHGVKRGVQPDDWDAGFVRLYDSSMLSGNKGAIAQRNEKRAQDQARFLTESLRGFYADTKNYLQKDLGLKSLVIASNWKTADDRVLGPLDKYAYEAGDAMARNAYYKPPSKNKVPWALNQGDMYLNQSAILHPESQLLTEIQYGDLPQIHWEFCWVAPNRFRAEYPLLCAAYGSLQGTDGFNHFTISAPHWQNTISLFPINTPVGMGQFPGTALMYRMNYIKEAPVVVHEALDLQDLYQLKGSAMTQAAGLDGFRDLDIPANGMASIEQLDQLDPRSFLVGRIQRVISDNPEQTKITDLSKYIDEDAKTITSVTGELVWNYEKGWVTVNSPYAQGATGFLQKMGNAKLHDVRIHSDNEYGTVLLVSLDNRPLASSEKILLQVMTEEKNYGWKTESAQAQLVKFPRNSPEVDCLKITDMGGAPIMVKEFQGRVELVRPDAAKLRVRALDVNGYALETVSFGDDKSLSIDLLPSTIHYIIDKPSL